MYAIVADIERYPQFLNWCQSVEVLDQAEKATVIARMHVAYAKLSFAFTTKNAMLQDKNISLSLVDGPFSNFSGEWQFQSLMSPSTNREQPEKEQGCKVSLAMDFRFERSFTSAVMAKMFEKIANSQLDAFQQRAFHLYKVG